MTGPNAASRAGGDGPTVVRDPEALSRATLALHRTGRTIALVPTMGALHEGHRTLIKAARRDPSAVVVVSIFVNPLQFGPNEDLDRYPRRFDEDVAMCREEGVRVVFAPTVEAMYPPGSDTRVQPGPLGDELEGARRPGHFAGVLTVVAKLFGIVRPDRAYFGEKDYQQLILVHRMVRDLRLGVDVIGVPTVREPDGLALSSRNAYLDDEQRAVAVTLSAALIAGVHAAGQGADAVLRAAGEVLAAEPRLSVDYLELRSPGLGPAPEFGPARLLVAGRVGTTRLIDNVGLRLGVADETPPEGSSSTSEGVTPQGLDSRGGPRCSAPC